MTTSYPFPTQAKQQIARDLLKEAAILLRSGKIDFICIALKLAAMKGGSTPDKMEVYEELKAWVLRLLGGSYVYTNWIHLKHPELWHHAHIAEDIEQRARDGRIRWLKWLSHEVVNKEHWIGSRH